MRIWSCHPQYLDAKGLVALWRETLLAKKVLEGNTKGYTNHPQLDRFKATSHPLNSINAYLEFVWNEATRRGYNFNKTKFEKTTNIEKISLTTGQLQFEIEHLQNKLQTRDAKKYQENKTLTTFDIHPLFELIDGAIESWEKI
ncbi:hypothetical protein CSB37_01935 [bacterium DOLZORAL124_38_8]|nr:MAG: hypothetical protein CSB37_01935 [bacterium DOLZORAL124_38_8]